MKITDLQDVYFSLLYECYEITLDDEVIAGARRALERMMAVPRDNWKRVTPKGAVKLSFGSTPLTSRASRPRKTLIV